MDPNGGALLTIEAAQELLASIVTSHIVAVQQITNTNDVFKVITERDGNFYIKFHTSWWYKDAPDTFGVVQREAAVVEMLKRKGMRLEYRSWIDCNRRIVNRSVLITSELTGTPLPVALKENPAEQGCILSALAKYLKQLHALEFPRVGYIETCGDKDMPYSLDPRENPWSDSHPCQKPENFKKFALGILRSKEAILPANLYSMLKESFEQIPRVLASEYRSPRFVINNYHPFHLHVRKDSSGWEVTGLYDFEAASAGSPVFDLILNELQITPVMGNLDWRPAFYGVYGRDPKFEAYKLMLLSYLLQATGVKPSAEIPDPEWFIRQLPSLIHAADYEAFLWFPL